jgi:hypothetical protein
MGCPTARNLREQVKHTILHLVHDIENPVSPGISAERAFSFTGELFHFTQARDCEWLRINRNRRYRSQGRRIIRRRFAPQ